MRRGRLEAFSAVQPAPDCSGSSDPLDHSKAHTQPSTSGRRLHCRLMRRRLWPGLLPKEICVGAGVPQLLVLTAGILAQVCAWNGDIPRGRLHILSLIRQIREKMDSIGKSTRVALGLEVPNASGLMAVCFIASFGQWQRRLWGRLCRGGVWQRLKLPDCSRTVTRHVSGGVSPRPKRREPMLSKHCPTLAPRATLRLNFHELWRILSLFCHSTTKVGRHRSMLAPASCPNRPEFVKLRPNLVSRKNCCTACGQRLDNFRARRVGRGGVTFQDAWRAILRLATIGLGGPANITSVASSCHSQARD